MARIRNSSRGIVRDSVLFEDGHLSSAIVKRFDCFFDPDGTPFAKIAYTIDGTQEYRQQKIPQCQQRSTDGSLCL